MAVGPALFPCIGCLGDRAGRNHVQQVLPLTLHSRTGLVGRQAGVDVRHGHPCEETEERSGHQHSNLCLLISANPSCQTKRLNGKESLLIIRRSWHQLSLPVLLPLCFLQLATLPWPLTFEPCCRERAAACLPGPPPRAAAVIALCS